MSADPLTVTEKLLRPQELAEAWQLDVSTIRKMFIDQPGVLKIGRPRARGRKRSYVTLRIPETVARRVFEERSR